MFWDFIKKIRQIIINKNKNLWNNVTLQILIMFLDKFTSNIDNDNNLLIFSINY